VASGDDINGDEIGGNNIDGEIIIIIIEQLYNIVANVATY
jgi:hypothetical protein